MTDSRHLTLVGAGLAGLAVGTLMWFLFLLLLPLGLWNSMLRKKSLMAAAKPA